MVRGVQLNNFEPTFQEQSTAKQEHLPVPLPLPTNGFTKSLTINTLMG